MEMKFRIRFTATDGDARPITAPSPGPWWHSGWDHNDKPIIVFITEAEDERAALEIALTFWPDADETSVTRSQAPHFYDRFPCPDWWDGENWKPLSAARE